MKMPFSDKRNSLHKLGSSLVLQLIEIKKSSSLQVLRLKQYLLNKITLKRVFSFTSTKGSISVEAALATSLFIFSVVAIMGILVVIDLQQGIAIAMENTAREIAQTIYYTDAIKDLTDGIAETENVEEKINNLFNESSLSEVDKEKVKKGINEAAFVTYVYGKFILKVNAENINQSYISGGMYGLDFSKSTYNHETGEISIVLKYQIKVPFISHKIWKINDYKRVYVKAWNGKNLAKDYKMVYITKNGSVYHTSKNCPHLDLNISKCNYGQLDSKRNKAGSKYDACELCKLTDYSDTAHVYVTDYGTAFHSSLSCGGIARSIIQIDEESVGDKRICKDCEERDSR